MLHASHNMDLIRSITISDTDDRRWPCDQQLLVPDEFAAYAGDS
jgi:hypothetical protein